MDARHELPIYLTVGYALRDGQADVQGVADRISPLTFVGFALGERQRFRGVIGCECDRQIVAHVDREDFQGAGATVRCSVFKPIFDRILNILGDDMEVGDEIPACSHSEAGAVKRRRGVGRDETVHLDDRRTGALEN